MTKPSPKPKSEYSIQTVHNALRLLESFDHEDELGVSELARRLELHKNNVFRLLATLEEGGYIEQCAESDRYRLGVRCLELAQAYLRSHDLARCARQVLDRLAASLQETVHVAVLEDWQVVHLDGVQPEGVLVATRRAGRRAPAHCTALGKVLLHGCGDEGLLLYDREHISAGLSAETERSLVDREKLLEHLRGVGVQGYALDLEEYRAGLHCAAAPVYAAPGQPRAAISVSGPAGRLSEERMLGEVVPAVHAAAQELSRALGA